MVKQLLAMPLPKVVFKYLGVIFIVDSEETALLTSRVGMAVLRVMLKLWWCASIAVSPSILKTRNQRVRFCINTWKQSYQTVIFNSTLSILLCPLSVFGAAPSRRRRQSQEVTEDFGDAAGAWVTSRWEASRGTGLIGVVCFCAGFDCDPGVLCQPAVQPQPPPQ